MKRNILKRLRLGEISYVTKPAQSDAVATIMKSDDPNVAMLVEKLSTTEGAQSFNAFLESDEKLCRAWRAQEEVWPVVDALRNSVNSIVADTSLSGDEKMSRIAVSSNEFVGAMQSYIPDIQEALLKMFNPIEKEDSNMTDAVAKVAELETKIADLEILSKMTDAEKAHLVTRSPTAAAVFKSQTSPERSVIMKAVAAADETITVDNVELRKSVVGDAMFNLVKSQAADIAKKNEDIAKAEAATLEVTLKKRAGDDLGKLPGDETAKVELLKAVAKLPENVRATFDAIAKAGNDALAGAFDELGVSKGQVDVTKAAKRDAAVAKVMSENAGMTKETALVKVLSADSSLYE